MKVNLSLFAGLHDLVGERSIELELADGATVSDVGQSLAQQYPRVTPLLPTLVYAVDDDYVPMEHRLADGDRVALIPPVSGGAKNVLVTGEPLDAPALTDLVRTDESGAIAVFHGVARNNSEGRRVIALEYDAHVSMAERKLSEVAEEIRRRWPITGIAIHHRTGRLAIGEASLLVAVSSGHRKEAFEACHAAVDRVKQIVPIWKKEIWEDGDGEWVAGHTVELLEAAQTRPGT
jgi:molybdopterin synthase catalytic subunit